MEEGWSEPLDQPVWVSAMDLPPCNRCMVGMMREPRDFLRGGPWDSTRERLVTAGIPEDCRNQYCRNRNCKEIELTVFRDKICFFARMTVEQVTSLYERFERTVWKPWQISNELSRRSRERHLYKKQKFCHCDYQMFCELETDQLAEWVCYNCSHREIESKECAKNVDGTYELAMIGSEGYSHYSDMGASNHYPPEPLFAVGQMVELYPPQFPHCMYHNVNPVDAMRWVEDPKESRRCWEYSVRFYDGSWTRSWWLVEDSLRPYGDVDVGGALLSVDNDESRIRYIHQTFKLDEGGT